MDFERLGQKIASLCPWGNEDTLVSGLSFWPGFGCSCTPDRVCGPDSWVHDLLAGRSCVGHMMDVSMGGLAV